MKQGKAPFIPRERLPFVLAACEGIHMSRDQAIILFTHYLGLRSKELAMLSVSDVIQGGRLVETVRLLRSITKGNKFREVFLVNADTRQIILQYLSERSDITPDAPLFISQKGGRFSPNSMQRLVKNIYQKSGTIASSHSGRRSFATNLIRQGVDIYTIKELLGHSTIATTQIYFYTSPERLKNAVSQLG